MFRPSLFALLLSLVVVPSSLLASDGDAISVQVVEISGSYADHPTGASLDPIGLLTGNMGSQKSFFKLCQRIDEYAADDSLAGVYFDLASNISMNQAQLAEIHRRIGQLNHHGKRTLAWLENASSTQYAIASSCQSIVIADFGGIDMPSLSMSSLYFRDAMDLLGVRASVARVGDFKGAIEPFTLPQMSEHLKSHYVEMLETMNDAQVARIAATRDLEVAQIRGFQKERWFRAKDAKEKGLVDALAAYGGGRTAAARLLGGDVSWREAPKKKKQDLSFFELFSKLMGSSAEKKTRKPTVAVLHLVGGIVDGSTASPGSMVSGPTVKEIERLQNDKKILGVVVRINSPGGSATASEAIRQALARLAARKPVVISMGDVAASGGYWISCLSRPVFAEAGTITGSIGVLAMKLYPGPLLKRVGVHFEDITLDESAAAMSLTRGWKPAETEKIQESINDVYGRFLRLVATSRNKTVDEVDPIAGGRVWSGAQAFKLGLVDHLGGLDAAITALGVDLKTDKFEIAHFPRKKSLFESLDLLGLNEEASLLDPWAAEVLQRRGFDLTGPINLLRQSLEDRAPQLWVLAPTEFVIR